MKFLFFRIAGHLNQTIEILSQIESASVQHESMSSINELFIIHRELFSILERLEKISTQHK